MATNPIPSPLPADLPTNWVRGQTIAPAGSDVGLAAQYGYNYLMAAVNAAQAGVNTLNNAFKKCVSIETGSYIGTGTYGPNNKNVIPTLNTPVFMVLFVGSVGSPDNMFAAYYKGGNSFVSFSQQLIYVPLVNGMVKMSVESVGGVSIVNFNYSNNEISFYATGQAATANGQYNISNTKYSYILFGY